MLEYWPYAARKKTFFFLTNIYFFDEIGYFNTEFVSPQHKTIRTIIKSFQKMYEKDQKYF